MRDRHSKQTGKEPSSKLPLRLRRKPYTFELGDKVRVDMSQKPRRGGDLWGFRNYELEIVDYTAVAPGAQKDAGHHQRVKVRVVGESHRPTDWISGAWFVPVT